MKNYTVVKVLPDTLVCSILDGGKQNVDIEGIVVSFEIGDVIVYHVEHGFCDIFRNDVWIGGISNFFTRLIQ